MYGSPCLYANYRETFQSKCRYYNVDVTLPYLPLSLEYWGIEGLEMRKVHRLGWLKLVEMYKNKAHFHDFRVCVELCG